MGQPTLITALGREEISSFEAICIGMASRRSCSDVFEEFVRLQKGAEN
jgi:hypothetical protein